MKTQKQIEELIAVTEKEYAHVLNRKRETIQVNAPVAMMQLSVESQLKALNWCLGREYKSTLTGGSLSEDQAKDILNRETGKASKVRGKR